MSNVGKIYSISAMFFAIISIVTSFIFFISFPAAVLSIFFGVQAFRNYYKKIGMTAIVTSSIGVIVTVIIFFNIVNALNKDGLIAGKWNIEKTGAIEFTDSGSYIWYFDKNNLDEYTNGYYTLSMGIYRDRQHYTMGYTVVLNQINYTDKTGKIKENNIEKWLIYTPDKEVLDEKSDEYEMMNLGTGNVLKIKKEKEKLFGIFNI